MTVPGDAAAFHGPLADLAQNTTLSLGARGLAAYLLVLPPSTPVSIRSVCAANPGGRESIAAWMRELESAGIVTRTITRGERGRMETTCVVSMDPHADDPLPESLPKPWSRRAAQNPSATDAVYVIGQPRASVVKIGVTSNLRSRLRGIQTGSPVPLSVLWWHPAGYELETKLHERFRRLRLEGEWFDFGSRDPVQSVLEAVRVLRPEDFRAEVPR